MMRLVMRVQATLFAMAILGLSLASLFVPLDRAMAAQPLAEISNPNSRLEIYAERTTVAAGQPLWLSLRFIPAQGWHTYWQNYGDSGKAPTFDWTLPAGWTVESPLYPLPHRIPVGPLMNYGYEAPQDLLVRVMPPADLPDQAFDLALSAEWLVCEEVCIPEFADLSFKMIPGKGSVTPDMAELFAKARAALPHDAPWQASARMSQDAFAVTIAMSPDDVSMASDAYFFPVTSGLIDYAGTQIATSGPDGLTLSVARSGHAPSMDSAAGVLILTNAAGQREGFALDVPIVMDPSLSVPDPADAGGFSGLELGLGQAILFALLGGMVLNLMPCVFPVLSLKAFSLIKAHGEGNVAARRDGLAYMAGILVSFLGIAIVFLALRATGTAIGWGFQLQSPVIVTLIVMVLFALGLNLVGVFEIGGRFSGIGQSLTEKKGISGAFFTGVLATIVATPCTAPFMAPALGFAAIQPVPVAVAIFLSLGAGLGLPYLLVSFFPPLRRLLPHPGRWMVVFRQLLAFPIFLTVVWLLWVLARQGGADSIGLALLLLVALGFLLWLWRVAGPAGRLARIMSFVAGLAVLAVMLMSLGYLAQHQSGAVAGQQGGQDAASYETAMGVADWSPEKVAELQANGQAVFVYFTADWCITCKVNERVALADPDVIASVKAQSIAVLKADWTNQNDAIAKALASFGRNGVPLYVYYDGTMAEPQILPQILTPGTLLSIFAMENS